MNPKVQAIYKESVRLLSPIYEEMEAESLTNMLFTEHLAIPRTVRLTSPNLELPKATFEKYQLAMDRMLQNEPIQYILGYGYFFDRKFTVNEATLIPRPETEELVDLVIRENKSRSGLSILDIGTGTGCIAISLELGLNAAQVTGWDISGQATEVARRNATALGSKARFETQDALKVLPEETLDIIVSNPPYIPEPERVTMLPNVLRYEPPTALFVPDKDPLLFYRRIADIGKVSLSPQGKIYFETHEDYGESVARMLEAQGYREIEVLKDLNGKNRMVKANL